MQKAFSLIELLIIVAIVGILSAVAVPNFLEAQQRSKLSRCKVDLRTLATAIESYRADNGAYLIAATGYPNPTSFTGPSLVSSALPGTSWVSYRFRRLTTPVAYITSIYADPFSAAGPIINPEAIPTLNYDSYDYFEGTALHPSGYLDTVTPFWRGAGVTSGAMWRLVGAGPDERNTGGGSWTGSPPLPALGIADYDPTNGTISLGDIVRIGGGAGPVNPLRLPSIDRVKNEYNVVIP